MNIGIIGCGNISAAYLRLGPMFKGVDIVAVADLNMDNATARASEFGVEARSVEALLASDDIDVIVVGHADLPGDAPPLIDGRVAQGAAEVVVSEDAAFVVGED